MSEETGLWLSGRSNKPNQVVRICFSSYLTQSRTKKIPPVSMPLNQSCRLQEFQRKRMEKIQSNDSDVNWCGTRVSEVSLLLWPFSTELLTSWNPSTQRSHNGGRSSGLCSDAMMSCLSILFCLMCKSNSPKACTLPPVAPQFTQFLRPLTYNTKACTS